MEEKTKIKIKNTAEQTGAAISLAALSLVASALGPIVNTVVQAKRLKAVKAECGEITVDDLKEALKSYATDFLKYHKNLAVTYVDDMKTIVNKGKKRLENTSEELQRSGVASILTLIDNAPAPMYVGEVSGLSREVLVNAGFGSFSLGNTLNSISTDKFLIASGFDSVGKFASVLLGGEVVVVGNVLISQSVHRAFVKMTDGAIKEFVFPKEQFDSIAEHARKRNNHLMKRDVEAAMGEARIDAAIAEQLARNTR